MRHARTAFSNLLGTVLVAGSLMLLATVTTGAAETEPGSGPLDGRTFAGAMGPDGQPKDIEDTFVFENGTFVSRECELRCKYPARPYFIRKAGNATEFISETRCPYKDARIIWRGTIQGDTIKGVSTWTVKRWYWTIEDTFEFEGKLVEQPTPVASSD
jgi:hypothetical protein